MYPPDPTYDELVRQESQNRALEMRPVSMAQHQAMAITIEEKLRKLKWKPEGWIE